MYAEAHRKEKQREATRRYRATRHGREREREMLSARNRQRRERYERLQWLRMGWPKLGDLLEELSIVGERELKSPRFVFELNGVRRDEVLEAL